VGTARLVPAQNAVGIRMGYSRKSHPRGEIALRRRVWLRRPGSDQLHIPPIRQAGDHDAFIRLDPVPNAPWEIPHRRAAIIVRSRNELILEGVLADAGESAADFLDEAVSEAGVARFVFVLGGGDISLRPEA
jgi:hypothetical protein